MSKQIGMAFAVFSCLAQSPGGVEERIARFERGLTRGIEFKGEHFMAPGMNIADRLAFYKNPAASIAVINNGVVEWARGYGVVEAGSSVRVTEHTMFQAAPLSKSVAALVAMRLVEQGKLNLDEDVNKRLVSWKVPENEFTKDQKVTLRGLLNHSSGLNVSSFPGYQADGPVPTLLQVLDGAKPAVTPPIRVDAQPGSVQRYTGTGFVVLQQLLTDVSGKPFPQLASELVLQPLGMHDSTFEEPLPARFTSAAASAHFHGQPIKGKYRTYPETAAAGLWSTPTDLARFAIEIQRAAKGGSKILSASSAQQMLTPVNGIYGLALWIEGKGRGRRFGGNGSTEGFRCQLLYYSDLDQGAVAMSNGQPGLQADGLGSEMLLSVGREYGWPMISPDTKTVAQVDASVLRSYEGQYEFRPYYIVNVKVEGSRLVLRDGDHRTELYPLSGSRFFSVDPETEIEFVKGADGGVTRLVVSVSGKAKRLPSS